MPLMLLLLTQISLSPRCFFLADKYVNIDTLNISLFVPFEDLEISASFSFAILKKTKAPLLLHGEKEEEILPGLLKI